MRFGIVSAALAVVFLLSCRMVPCSAFYVPLSIEEMTEAADVILMGTVEEVLHVRTHREVTVSVERYLKNPLEAETVTVVALGATVGSTTLWVEDQPEFQESERVLLFLRDDPSFLDDNPQGFYQVVGMDQGKFTVGSDGAVNVLGEVIEDGFRVGEIEFKLSARSPFRNLVLPGVVALLSLGAIYLFYRVRVSSSASYCGTGGMRARWVVCERHPPIGSLGTIHVAAQDLTHSLSGSHRGPWLRWVFPTHDTLYF